MPVRFLVADHPAHPVTSEHSVVSRPEDILQATWGQFATPPLRCAKLLQSSFDNPDEWIPTQIFPASAPRSKGTTFFKARSTPSSASAKGGTSKPKKIKTLWGKANKTLYNCITAGGSWHSLRSSISATQSEKGASLTVNEKPAPALIEQPAPSYLASVGGPTALYRPGHLADVQPDCNGFVNAIRRAYDRHHHLIIRPDDVWVAILSQFNFYVNANSQKLRSHFVAHEGKMRLDVDDTNDWGSFATAMTTVIERNLVDKGLKDWILPDFTTTTKHDTIISAAMMMSTLKDYFAYYSPITCGIPSVTLEGEKEDWEKLLARIDRLKTYGEEPEAWAALLRPILTRFVQAFNGDPDVGFWNQVCHREEMGSGSEILYGWVTAFCIWNKDGRWMGRGTTSVDSILQQNRAGGRSTAYTPRKPYRGPGEHEELLVLDGISYPEINVDDVPAAYCEVQVVISHDEIDFTECFMVSGHVAVRVEGEEKDAIRPNPAWFMFETGRHL